MAFKVERTAGERFWEKVDKAPGCWVWTAAKRFGYGSFWSGSCQVVAHRWAYEELVGPVPDGLDLDHLCRNRACVNPSHLEPVTRQVNLLRGAGLPALQRQRTHCPKGHSLSGENLYVCKSRPNKRGCRACRRETMLEYHSRPGWKAKHAAYERRRRAAKKAAV